MKSVSIARIGLIFFCLLIILGSSIPGNKIPEAFALTPDKLIHCAEYFVLGLLIHQWLTREFPFSKKRNLFFIALLIGSVFGIIDENYQRLTPGRTPDVWDWVLDTVGVLLAVIVSHVASRKKQTQ
ncbi:MAG: VanZ family protein [Flammeovirgaceae bacterium]|jgi:VanZ family protein|nr:VanZ family protein [Flammeovirgaceae bacterium]